MEPEVGWVKARSECSLGKLFRLLQKGCESDVEAISKLAAEASLRVTFTFAPYPPNKFSVLREQLSGLISVDFTLSKTDISVSGCEFPFKALPSLNTQGDCVLIVNGTEMELWQVRRAALDSFFFGAFG